MAERNIGRHHSCNKATAEWRKGQSNKAIAELDSRADMDFVDMDFADMGLDTDFAADKDFADMGLDTDFVDKGLVDSLVGQYFAFFDFVAPRNDRKCKDQCRRKTNREPKTKPKLLLDMLRNIALFSSNQLIFKITRD